MSEDKTNEVKEVLKEIYEEGFKIKEILKKESNYISKRPKEEILIDPKIFYYSLFESFWKLFKLVSNNIENPLIQPWTRIILEHSLDIFSYYQKNEIEKKQIACKYWLCSLGFVGGKRGNLNYDNFLRLMDNPKEQNNFSEIKKEGYPIKKIHNIWYHLFPKINENELPNLVEKYFLTIKGNSIKKSQLEMFFKDMSLYHHPNIVLDKLESEFNDKSHIFRGFALISMCGISLIRFSYENNLYKGDKDSIEKLNDKINKLFSDLYLKRKL